MQHPFDQLARSVLQKNSLADCSIDELQQLVSKYPYFAPAQLLLSEKMRSQSDPGYEDQLQKTVLFFSDPLWLDQLINQRGNVTIMKAEEQKDNIPEKPLTGPATPPKDEMLFEPYHTVDYFASQGIKFTAEEKPKDKFGQQLKSFTEWLKTMKRLPVQEVVKEIDTGSEKKVEQMAEHSIEDREVVTEAMADVWEKQGNAAKAIEIYTKLSLLNPSKSAYFAARIEQLKAD